MPTDPVTVYADTILTYGFRAPGVVRTDFGLPNIEGEDPQLVLRLILPLDVARSHATALTKVVAAPSGDAGVPARVAATLLDVAAMGLRTLALLKIAIDLGRLVLARPDLAEPFAQIERQAMRDADNAVTEGVPIDEEAGAMRALRRELTQLFAEMRGEGPEGAAPGGS